MCKNEYKKNYILHIYQTALYYVNSTVNLPFVIISKGNYFISVLYYIIFLGKDVEKLIRGTNPNDLIVGMNNTKYYVIMINILI